MTYSTAESSEQDGRPQYRYEFVTADATTRFTSGQFDDIDGANTWTAVAIGHTEISMTGDVARDGVTVTLPRSNAFALSFVKGTPDVPTSLTIYRAHPEAADEWVTYWKGRVDSARAGRSTIALECESILTSVKRSGLQPRYMKMCIHPLYGRGCNLNVADWEVGPLSVSAVDGAEVTATGANAQPDGWYFGGTLRFGTISRLIIGHVGNVLTLARAVPGLTTSGTVHIAPGCNHSPEKCNDTFSNIANYGGFPWIPVRNPFGGTSID